MIFIGARQVFDMRLQLEEKQKCFIYITSMFRKMFISENFGNI